MIQACNNYRHQAKETVGRKQNAIPGLGPLGRGESSSLYQRVGVSLQDDQSASDRGDQEQGHINILFSLKEKVPENQDYE